MKKISGIQVSSGVAIGEAYLLDRSKICIVKHKIEELKAGLPKGVQIGVFYDRSKLIQRTLRTVRTNLLEGGLLVIGSYSIYDAIGYSPLQGTD